MYKAHVQKCYQVTENELNAIVKETVEHIAEHATFITAIHLGGNTNAWKKARRALIEYLRSQSP